MHIVTDSTANLHAEHMDHYGVHVVPLQITLDGRTYRSGVDIEAEDFFRLLETSSGLPNTSQPSPEEFINLYRKLAVIDPDILSIHLSDKFSGTYNSARIAAREVADEANVTVIDSGTVAAPLTWQVEAAVRLNNAGRSLEEILETLDHLQRNIGLVFTIPSLDYLINGGRIGHMRGLIANTFDIKPILGIGCHEGITQLGRVRTFKRAVNQIGDIIAKQHAPGTALRVELHHANNPEAVERLRSRLDEMFDCHWKDTTPITPIIAAHSGPGLVAAAYAPMNTYPDLP